MANLENIKDMYDVAMKPRMLRTLMKEDLPNEKRPFTSMLALSRIVSTVKTHDLLSESESQSLPDSKHIQRWKSAVDDWADRLLTLVSNSSMPDKCWAGICLLGVTCQQCSADRFLASYAVWLDKLLVHAQSSVDSQFVKVASCTSILELIRRLAEFPNAKKDGNSHTARLLQPVLKLLQEDSSEALWEAAAHLLCAVMTLFPASLHRHYDNVELESMTQIFRKPSLSLSDNGFELSSRLSQPIDNRKSTMA